MNVSKILSEMFFAYLKKFRIRLKYIIHDD